MDGLKAGQMETEQARHETEESLILAQFGTIHTTARKLQNGGPSSEGESQQITDDTNWKHFRPSTGANFMKRHRDNCNSPASVQGLFDQSSYMTKGEAMHEEYKHALNKQSLLVHQSKKLKVDSESKINDNMSSCLVDNLPELTNATDFECNAPQTGIKSDKRTSNFANGDILCLPRNKQVSNPNGAVSSPSTIDSTPVDLLEKTLSQYYPEQVSTTSQTSGSQLNAINGSLAHRLPSNGAQHPSLTSGLPDLAQLPESQQQQSEASVTAKGGNSYNSVNYVVNGYSNSFGADHQQQQRHQPESYCDQEMSLCQPSVMIPHPNTANNLKHQNDAQCYSKELDRQGIYAKVTQEFNQNSFLGCSADLQSTDTKEYGAFSSTRIQKLEQNKEPRSDQHQHHSTENQNQNQNSHQYGIQSPNYKLNSGNISRADSAGPMGPSRQLPDHAVLEKRVENMSQQRDGLCSTSQQRGWIELKSSNSQQQTTNCISIQAQEQDMWKEFPANIQSERQTENTNSQLLEPNPEQRFQTREVFTGSSQKPSNYQQQKQDHLQAKTHSDQAQHNAAPEWQHLNSKVPQMRQDLPQKSPQQCSFPQNQQTDSHCHTQVKSEHLCEDPDLQDILTPGFLATQEQQHCHLPRPLSHPPQFEEQQLKSPNYRPHSQPHPGQHQHQPSQSFRNHSDQFNNQHIHHGDLATFGYNTTQMKQLEQHQKQYPPTSGSSNLNQFQPQQPNNHCHQPNHVDFPQTSTQSQHHIPQVLLNQQVSTQMYPKPELQPKTSCTQFQKGPRLPQGPVGPQGDFQRHAALRMHLLQKQERQGPPHHPQSTCDPKHESLRAVKIENGPRFELSGSQEQQTQMQEKGTGVMYIKQENQQSLCEKSNSQASILASMEQSLRQYQLSPVFEKKSIAINSSNKVKVESSGSVTILSTNTDLNRAESSVAPATVALKNTPVSTPKKENLLQSFMDSPMKLLDTPIRNLLDTPMKTQYDIASCHCVGKAFYVEFNTFLMT